MKKYYYNHFSSIETFLVFATTVAFLYLDNKHELFKTVEPEFLYTILGSVVGLLGFVIAFTAIIFSLHKSDKLVYFQNSPSYNKVFSVFTDAIGWMTVVVLVLFLVLILNYEFPRIFISALLIFTFLITLIKIYRCVWVTKKMFELSVK